METIKHTEDQAVLPDF